MLRFFDFLVPRICFSIDGAEGGGSPATEAPPVGEPSGEPAAEPAPAASEAGKDTSEKLPPTWPGRDEVLAKIKEGREGGKPAEEPGADPAKPAEPAAKDTPEIKYADPSKPLTELIEGLDAKEFEGKTVKDFADYIKKTENVGKELEAIKGIKEFLEKNNITDKDLSEIVKSRTTVEPQKVLERDDFDTEEEYQAEVEKAEAHKANEERLQKLEEKAVADATKEFNQTFNKTIDEAIGRHTDEVTKESLLTNAGIDLVVDMLGKIPSDVDIDLFSIMDKAFDLMASEKKSYADKITKSALEKAKPETIKEYLKMNTENQKKTLESMGQTPAPDFAKTPEPPSGKDFENGSLKARAKQLIREIRGNKT